MKHTPDKFREELKKEFLRLNELLFSRRIDEKLLDALKSVFPSLSLAPVLHWIPEQGEDIYWVLIDCDRIAVVEIPWCAAQGEQLGAPFVKILSVHDYKKKGFSKTGRRKFEAALELMSEHLEKTVNK